MYASMCCVGGTMALPGGTVHGPCTSTVRCEAKCTAQITICKSASFVTKSESQANLYVNNVKFDMGFMVNIIQASCLTLHKGCGY